MNGYRLLADGYRDLVVQGKVSEKEVAVQIKALDFLASCNWEEICALFNSSAFNDIVMGYLSEAIRSADIPAKEEAEKKITMELRALLDSKGAGEILKNRT